MAITQQLLSLIPAIYDAALDPAQWALVLERLTELVGGHCATVMQGLGDSDARFITHGYSPDILHSYYGAVAGANMFARRAATVETGTVESDGDILPKTAFRASSFYNDFLIRHLDADAVLTGMMWRDRRSVVAFNICRSRRAGDFERRDKTRLRTLMPHFARAIAIERRLGTLESSVAGALDLLDRAPCAILVTTADGHVVYANAPGERLLRQGDAIASPEGGLRAATPALTGRLRRIVGEAAAGGGGAMALARPDGGTLHAVAAPLRTEFAGLRPAPERVLLTIRDPLEVPAFPAAYLCDLFGLTPAEARLAVLLQQGHSPHEAASALGISRHTARVHLNALLSKTGTHRQAELMRRIMALPPVFPVLQADQVAAGSGRASLSSASDESS